MSPTKRPSSVAGLRRAVAPAPSQAAPEATTEPTEAKMEKYPARISMTASVAMKRALELARLDDGTEVTARLRAMITLWQEDPELRGRVDKLARDLR